MLQTFGTWKAIFYNKRPISHRGMYINMDTRKHYSRECHKHFRTHAYTHSIQLCFFAITPKRTHYHWRQYAKEPACKSNHQPGAFLYYNSHNIHYIIHIWLIFIVKEVQDHSMFWDQYLSQSHAYRCAELYLSSLRRRSASCWGNAMEPIVYDTVMNAKIICRVLSDMPRVG